MKQSNKTEWAIWGVCALSFAVTLALLPLLPARIPVHWNVDGQIDGWAARPGAFFGPAMGLGLSLLMKFLPYIDPRRRSYEKFGRAYDAFRLALALFVLILQGVTLYAAFYPDGLDVSRIIAACVGAAVRSGQLYAQVPAQLFLRYPYAVDAGQRNVLAAHPPLCGAAVVLGRSGAGGGQLFPLRPLAGRGHGGSGSRARRARLSLFVLYL